MPAFRYNVKRIVDTTRGRERRYRKLCQVLGLRTEDRVLDVGCGNGNSFERFNAENEIVGLDLSPQSSISQPNFRYVSGDAADMSCFRDKEFDVVLCIGVLEHVLPLEKLEQAASEIRRVGRAYAVVVPHKYTLIEPHHQLPFWQLYPERWKRLLARHVSLTWYGKNPEGRYREMNFLETDAWRRLFPDARVFTYNHVRPGLVWDQIICKRREDRAHGRGREAVQMAVDETALLEPIAAAVPPAGTADARRDRDTAMRR